MVSELVSEKMIGRVKIDWGEFRKKTAAAFILGMGENT